jgi:hypothetical protein
MKTDFKFFRWSLFISSFLLLAAAIAVFVAVIPVVKADTFPAATPSRAAAAFLINALLNLLAALVFVALAIRLPRGSHLAATLLRAVAILVLLLAFGLFDAASAFRSHGPAMRTVSILLILCSAFDLLAAVTAAVISFKLPERK